MITAPSVERVYMDNGTGARATISVFQAEVNTIPEGAFMIGQVGAQAYHPLFVSSTVLFNGRYGYEF